MPSHETANRTPGSGNVSSSDERVTYKAQGLIEPRLLQATQAGHTQRILLVEDDQSLAALEAGILTAYGYEVVAVYTGEEAITEIQQRIPDLVVLDLELTGKVNGWDVLSTLRTQADVPVLITTSSSVAVRAYMRTHQESKLTLDHLPKPYPMQTFLKRVQRMLISAPE